MARNIEYIIGQVFANARRRRRFSVGKAGNPNIREYKELPGIPEQVNLNTATDDSLAVTYLGTPIWSDVILRVDDNDEGLQLITVLMTVSQSKNIIQTAIQGRNGTVKEYISDGDYQINFKGAIVNEEETGYPQEAVSSLMFYLKGATALEVVSPFLQQFGIYNIVVTDYNFPQQTGFQNMQLFDFNAISDVPIQLIEDF